MWANGTIVYISASVSTAYMPYLMMYCFPHRARKMISAVKAKMAMSSINTQRTWVAPEAPKA